MTFGRHVLLAVVVVVAGLTASGCTNGDNGGAINGPGGGHVTTAPPTSK
jgi:hypothetical protein